MSPKREPEKEPGAVASIMQALNELPEGSQARVLLAACGWCGFDGAIYGLIRHATGEEPKLDERLAEIVGEPPKNYS